jgi:hypothetical protein
MPDDDVGAVFVYYGLTTTDGMFTYFIFPNHGSDSAFYRYPVVLFIDFKEHDNVWQSYKSPTIYFFQSY